MNLWGFELNDKLLSISHIKYLNNMPVTLPSVEWIWQEMDSVWDDLHLNNQLPLNNQNISEYYSHPLWLVNGIFTAKDITSKLHRKSVANYLQSIGVKSVADFGGGFGELALTIDRNSENITVDIVEPYPSSISLDRIQNHKNIRLVKELKKNYYTAIIAQDVLEHLEEPIDLAYKLALSVKNNNYVIFLNCFEPVVKCHIPSTFHLRHNFKNIMIAMGLELVGTIPGAEHAQVFRKSGSISLEKAKNAERKSRITGALKNLTYPILAKVKKFLVKI